MGVGKEAGAARVGGGAAGQASRRPRPRVGPPAPRRPSGSASWVRAGAAGRRLPDLPGEHAGKCHLRRPALEPCSVGPGSVLLLLIQTLLSGLTGIFFLPELLDLSNWAPGLALASPPTADLGAPSFTMPEVSGVGRSGTEAQI